MNTDEIILSTDEIIIRMRQAIDDSYGKKTDIDAWEQLVKDMETLIEDIEDA